MTLRKRRMRKKTKRIKRRINLTSLGRAWKIKRVNKTTRRRKEEK